MGFTTIQVNTGTLERLKFFKNYPRESYDEVINKVLDDVEEDVLSEETIKDIKGGLDDIKTGKTKSIERISKEMGIKLK